MSDNGIFEASLEFPDPDAARRLAALVGIDDQKERLEKGLRLMLDKGSIERWSEKHHGKKLPIVGYFQSRPPLFILAGDVGTGKTALAENIGDAVAKAEKLDVTLHRLSLSARGTGMVGEMTKLVSAAFSQVGEYAKKAKSTSGKAKSGHILMIDEADALAQSRETSQMHHEDRAGVNALIRGINEFAEAELPVAVIMCTNRLGAIDPAVRRRAAEILSFGRPGPDQREIVLSAGLAHTGMTDAEIQRLVEATGERNDSPAFTYSDLTQRLIPNIALDAYPDQPIKFTRALKLATEMVAAPTFDEGK